MMEKLTKVIYLEMYFCSTIKSGFHFSFSHLANDLKNHVVFSIDIIYGSNWKNGVTVRVPKISQLFTALWKFPTTKLP